ncbi:MAG TPA: type III secretion system cytoplasmic ring protein SctQ [Ramlibacter sp.]|jgi:type III secretion protein Q|uniref:type III secretion system cytoplasmic ring protein SctQ n=1 Tax=Ramlibacter sp. TaxID=1917967 RepID=UPI002D6D6BF4|nr:type III secretion system cytoplasmic ring protein SctQ [Ramlibacter sp.]HZY20517.1 type III secretion system cytoplasmic ring protein SctQ [Ramlibacter sp.]
MTTSHPPAEKLRLTRLSRNEAQARSAIAQRARGCRFGWAGRDWELTLVPRSDVQPPEPAHWTVQAQWAGADFALRLPAAAARGWIAARFPSLDAGELSDELAAAVLETACGDLLAMLSGLQRGPAQLLALTRDPVALDAPHAFDVELRQDAGQVVRGSLATGSLGLMLVAGLLARTPPVTNALDADSLPVQLRAEIGGTWLPPEELRSLRIGDAVLLEDVFLTPDGHLCLTHEGGAMRVRRDGAALVVTEAFTPKGSTMPSTPTAPAGDQPLAADQLPLRLAFDLGERQLTLGELRGLQVGQSIDLARPLSSAVSLRVNGALVGTGELVEIDGRLGVTITSLAGAGA